MYVSQYKPGGRSCFLEHDKLIFNFLINFCKKKKLKLSFCSSLANENEILFRKNFVESNWIFLPYINSSKTYAKLNQHQMIVSNHSSLGLEALSKGLKCAIFYKSFPEQFPSIKAYRSCYKSFPMQGSYKKYPRSGVFWTSSTNYQSIEKTFSRVFNLSNIRWLDQAGSMQLHKSNRW